MLQSWVQPSQKPKYLKGLCFQCCQKDKHQPTTHTEVKMCKLIMSPLRSKRLALLLQTERNIIILHKYRTPIQSVLQHLAILYMIHDLGDTSVMWWFRVSDIAVLDAHAAIVGSTLTEAKIFKGTMFSLWSRRQASTDNPHRSKKYLNGLCLDCGQKDSRCCCRLRDISYFCTENM